MEWLIYGGIAIVVGWIILQPQRWGKRDEGSFDSGGTPVGVHPNHRRDSDDSDSDSDGGDGGDGGAGGGGDD